MKTSCKLFYNEAIDKFIDLVSYKKEFQYLSQTIINILKNVYKEPLNTSLEISALDNYLILLWRKDDRELRIIIRSEDIIEYFLTDFDISLDDRDIFKEEGSLIYDIQTTLTRIVNWLIKGNLIENLHTTNNLIKRYTKAPDKLNTCENS